MDGITVGERRSEQRGGRAPWGTVLRMASAAGVLCAGLLGLSGCKSLLGTHDVDISESQLTLLMARQFPMERKVMEVIDLNITNPVLTLLPQDNRVGTELDVTAVDRLFGSTALGHVRLDYGLRFQPSDHTIRMTGVRVRELSLSSGSSGLHGAAQRIGGLVAESALENLVLYRMNPAQADEMDRLDLVASPITVTPQGLHMSVSPRQG